MSGVSPPPVPSPPAPGGRSPISRARIDRFIVRALAAFGLVFGAQTVPSVMANLPYVAWPGAQISVTAVFGSLVLFGLCVVMSRFVRLAAAVVAIVYALTVAWWPFIVADPNVNLPMQPWLWFLLTVATTCAVVAFPAWWAAIYTALVPVVYGLIRTMPAGGGVTFEFAALDSSYAMILGGVLLIIILMARQASSGVDESQAMALDRYAKAVRENAVEAERVQVDAIVHDSVLTTFLSAAAAETPDEKARAARMAEQAIGHLHAAEAAGPVDRSSVPLVRLAERLRSAASAFSARFAVTVRNVSTQMLPMQAAEAVYSATVQAMVNSMQHAGDSSVSRTLTLTGTWRGGVDIEVTDSGCGFDRLAVPRERLGLRVSISERMAGAGGLATITSHPGRGTRIQIRWPSSRGVAPDPAVEWNAQEQGAVAP